MSTRNISKEYGLIRSKLEKSGILIGLNDLIIASIIKANNGILVTHNTESFQSRRSNYRRLV